MWVINKWGFCGLGSIHVISYALLSCAIKRRHRNRSTHEEIHSAHMLHIAQMNLLNLPKNVTQWHYELLYLNLMDNVLVEISWYVSYSIDDVSHHEKKKVMNNNNNRKCLIVMKKWSNNIAYKYILGSKKYTSSYMTLTLLHDTLHPSRFIWKCFNISEHYNLTGILLGLLHIYMYTYIYLISK